MVFYGIVRLLLFAGVVLILTYAPFIFIGLLALIVTFCLFGFLRWEIDFRIKGYRAARIGRDDVFYEERDGAQTRKITIGGEMMIRGPHVIYVPTDEEWKKQMPEWAKERKNEIIARMKNLLKTKHYEFLETTSTR